MLQKNKYIRTVFIVSLLLYWPAIFLLTHLERVPGWIIRAQMSDKTLHFIGYMLLAYLWWNAISYSRRPGLKYYFTWVTLGLMAIYGIADEILQGLMHRTPDLTDFRADMLGVLLALLIMWVFEIRVATAWVVLTVIFVLTVLAQSDPFMFASVVGYVFYWGGMAFASLLWLDYINEKYRPKAGKSIVGFWFLAILLPIGALGGIYLAAHIGGKELFAGRLGAGLVGIATGITAAMIITAVNERKNSV